MISRSTLVHLRIPFSLYLMPVFSFAASQARDLRVSDYLLVFFTLHLFLYPASNGFNSYFDRDKGSIGGLERPPEVTRDLLGVSLLLDLIALALASFAGWAFALACLVYGLVSKAYSHPAVRLKKKPIAGLLTVTFFQGAFTYSFCCLVFLHQTALELFAPEVLVPAAVSSLLLLGSYPMTQIYQHQEDAERGDLTVSRILGVRGTFLFSATFLTAGSVGLAWVLFGSFGPLATLALWVALSPALIHFFRWYLRARRDPLAADFRSTERMNQLASLGLTLLFTGLTLSRWIGLSSCR